MNQELMLLNEMDANLAWFKNHLSELKEKYDNTFVAIKDEKILSVSKDFNKLLINLKNMNEDPARTFIQFISKIPVIL